MRILDFRYMIPFHMFGFCLLASPCGAMGLGFGVSAGYGHCSMTSFNEGIAYYARSTGATLEEIDGTGNPGLDLGLRFESGFQFGLAWEYIASSSYTRDDGAEIEFWVPAEVYSLVLRSTWPVHRRARVGVSVRLGEVSTDGHLTMVITDVMRQDVSYSGNSHYMEAAGTVEWTPAKDLGVFADIGFRAPGVVEAEPDRAREVGPVELDYGGWVSRIGVRYVIVD